MTDLQLIERVYLTGAISWSVWMCEEVRQSRWIASQWRSLPAGIAIAVFMILAALWPGDLLRLVFNTIRQRSRRNDGSCVPGHRQ